MLCVLILYISGGTYSLKSTPNERFFWETFHGNFIYSQRFSQKSAERKSPKKYFFCILFWCLAWDSNPGFSSNKPSSNLYSYSKFEVWKFEVVFIYKLNITYNVVDCFRLSITSIYTRITKWVWFAFEYYWVLHLTFFSSTSADFVNVWFDR